MDDSIHGVNYLDDLLNEMTKEDDEEEEIPAKNPTPTPATNAHRATRPESFRGDFDYLEALLNDIGPMEPAEAHMQQSPSPSHSPATRRPPSMAPRATNAAFDLESTLKDLEDTFYNGMEGGNLKRTTSIISWPIETQEVPNPNKRDDVSMLKKKYMDVLDELVKMNLDVPTEPVEQIHSKPAPQQVEDTSVLDRMIDSFAAPTQPPKVQTPPKPKTALGAHVEAHEVEDDISYLDQMLDSFIASDPRKSKSKPKGVAVLPEGPIPQLKQRAPQESNTEVPHATKDPPTAFILSRSRGTPALQVAVPVRVAPKPYIAAPSRVTRPPVPAAASTPAPAKIPALRSTTTFTSTLGRTTVNMDDLLDQVIHSIVTDDPSAASPDLRARQSQKPSQKNAGSTDDDELMSQILSNQELNMGKIERKVQGASARKWMVPFSELEPFLASKLGIGNHGEAYRPGIWRGSKVVVKRWNTSLSMTLPLQEELTTLVSISHPNIIPIIGACGDGRGLYTLTEYIPGANLHGFLHNGGLSGEKDSTVTILRIALQIAQAMAFLHSQGIVHRSLAPKNVILDSNVAPHLRDYGLAALKDEIWTTQRASNPRFPLYDSQYVAPELMRGSQYTMQVDVYSFGVLLWEAFAGESAHDGLVLRDLHVQKLIKLCVSASPPARPTFATVVKILSQPMDTLLKFSKPASAGESGFFGQDQPQNPRASTFSPYSPPQVRPQSEYNESFQSRAADDAEEDKKLQKVLFAISDLIRTPSDQAQLKAINAIENLAQKEWNVARMLVHGFVPHIVDLLKSKFHDVQETASRVVATMLKNVDFCQSFIKFRGLAAILDQLSGPDDGVRLVAAKALTVAAYTTPDLARSDVLTRNGGAALASLLRVENEFVRVQTAWALGQLLVPGHPLTEAFAKADGVALLSSLLITGGSPAAELRALGALLPLIASPHIRATIPPSVPRKVFLLLSSPQQPLRSQALQVVTLLAADKATIPILLEGHGLSVALMAIIQPPLNNPLLLPALDLLRSIAETPAHASILVRAGLREALHPHLASVDSTILKSANVLYNLLV